MNYKEETTRVDEILKGSRPASGFVNQYVALFHELFPRGSQITDPRRGLKRLLDQARRISGDYYLSGRFIVEIKAGVLENILAIPAISDHAKQRLLERFRRATHEEKLLQVALAFAFGKELSQMERRRLGIAAEIGAVEHQGCIYLLNKEAYTVITVWKTD